MNKKIEEILQNNGKINEGITLVKEADTEFFDDNIAPYFIIFESGVLPIPIRNDNDLIDFLKPSPMFEVVYNETSKFR
ncbi:MAG: hypothetical protein WC679_01485 [Bacteroidales bacterium]|jgi:hypothetical protein